MFESNMCDNIAQQNILKAIQGELSNTWRKLVTKEFRQWLDRISIKQEMVEENCDD